MENTRENIIDYFFKVLETSESCTISRNESQILIKPRSEKEYYEPTIVIRDIHQLEETLTNYLKECKSFYIKNGKNPTHERFYFLYNMLTNMNADDTNDLVKYINKRIAFFKDDTFAEYKEKTLIHQTSEAEFYVKRTLNFEGQETPFSLEFSMKVNGEMFDLPRISYAFDENNICHIYTIQFGRHRIPDIQNKSYKSAVNNINSGVHKYRNVSPSFVLAFRLFLDLLKERDINKILIPDFLCFRYKRYFRAKTVTKSDVILTRILDQFLLLCQRMEYQFPFFNIFLYANELDSYTHINLDDESYKKY